MRLGSLVFCALLSFPLCASGRDVPVPAGNGFAKTWAIDGFSHDLWTAVLSNHVDSEGLVDYASVASDERFSEYLYRLANTDPGKVGGSKARLAFWINAYNALVVQGVLETLPQGRRSWAEYSVLKVRVKGVLRPGKGFFAGLRFVVGGRRYTLDEIEKGVLLGREKWTSADTRHYRRISPTVPDPRIHFALVCAARGCPKLRREAFEASRVDAQLDEAVRATLKDPNRAVFDAASRTMRLTKILKWYGDDFSNADYAPHASTLAAFLARYVENASMADSLTKNRWKIKYLEYDWKLNVQR